MQTDKLFFAVTLGVVLALPFGCGKSDDDGDGATVSGGHAGASGLGGGSGSGGRNNRGGNGGRSGQNTSGSGPTGCEGLTPKSGEGCMSQGIVCPSQLGSCVCQRSGWQCFEVGGNEGGSGSIELGGAGPGGSGGAAGAGGEGLAGESLGGQAGVGGAMAGAGGEGG